MTTRFLDFTGGSDGNDGTTFANRKKTLTSAITGLTGGDTVKVMASPAATSLGQSATWTNASDTVTLTSAVTTNITDCESAWTANGVNVTSTASTATFIENTKSANHVIASAFTTGLAAFFATGTLDLSAYQQTSFWIRSTGTHASGVFTLTLCSDVAGVTAVHTLTVPALTANTWTPVTINNGGALNSAIASVALNCVSDPGAVTVNIDNIIACKASSSADSLTLTSLISLNTDSNTPWHTIRSINGTSVKLGFGMSTLALPTGYNGNYYGSTVTATTYKREPIMLTAIETANVAGSSVENPLSIEFGWDTSAMTTQSDITWIRQTNPAVSAITATANHQYWNKIYAAGSLTGVITSTAQGLVMGECGFAGCLTGFSYPVSSIALRISDLRYITGCNTGIYIGAANMFFKDLEIHAKKIWGASGTSLSAYGVRFEGVSFGARGYGSLYIDEIRNFRYGVDCDTYFDLNVYNTVFSANATADFFGASPSVHRLFNCSASTFVNGPRIYTTKYGQTVDDHRVFWGDTGASLIVSATDQRHTASDFSWKFSPKTVSYEVHRYTPLRLSVAKVACPANEARSVSLWFRRDSTSLSMQLRLPKGQIAGVSSDVTTAMAAAINTWSQLTVNFTPTEAGVVEVFAEAWGGTSLNGWVDDLAVA